MISLTMLVDMTLLTQVAMAKLFRRLISRIILRRGNDKVLLNDYN